MPSEQRLIAAAPLMAKALRFYAEPRNWQVAGLFIPSSPISDYRPDCGATARAALAAAGIAPETKEAKS